MRGKVGMRRVLGRRGREKGTREGEVGYWEREVCGDLLQQILWYCL